LLRIQQGGEVAAAAGGEDDDIGLYDIRHV
jgi:hypothetical protein